MDDPQRWTRGVPRLVLGAGMLMYPFVTAALIPQYATGRSAVAGYAIVGGFSCCYVLSAVAVAVLASGWRRRPNGPGSPATCTTCSAIR
jgi:hypothetical protein